MLLFNLFIDLIASLTDLAAIALAASPKATAIADSQPFSILNSVASEPISESSPEFNNESPPSTSSNNACCKASALAVNAAFDLAAS